jgi:hypothetical protein
LIRKDNAGSPADPVFPLLHRNSIPVGNHGSQGESRDEMCDQWYLKIDDEKDGSPSRSEVVFFLRPPRLRSMLDVMCSPQEGF